MLKIAPSTLRVFAAEHQRLDELLEKVERAWTEGNQALGAELFARLERRLQRHMEVEEHYLFSSIRSRADPVACALIESLEREHRHIAVEVAALEAHMNELDEHVSDDLARLFTDVRAHEAHEEEDLFPICDVHVQPEVRATAARELDRMVSGPPSRSAGPPSG